MVKFACESTEMENGIRKLCDRIMACGGYVDDRLTIVEKGGDFMITAPESVERTKAIIRVPK